MSDLSDGAQPCGFVAAEIAPSIDLLPHPAHKRFVVQLLGLLLQLDGGEFAVWPVGILQFLDGFDHSLAIITCEIVEPNDEVFWDFGLLVAFVVGCTAEAATEMAVVSHPITAKRPAAEMAIRSCTERGLILHAHAEGSSMKHDMVDVGFGQLHETEQAVNICVSTAVEFQAMLFWHSEALDGGCAVCI